MIWQRNMFTCSSFSCETLVLCWSLESEWACEWDWVCDAECICCCCCFSLCCCLCCGWLVTVGIGGAAGGDNGGLLFSLVRISCIQWYRSWLFWLPPDDAVRVCPPPPLSLLAGWRWTPKRTSVKSLLSSGYSLYCAGWKIWWHPKWLLCRCRVTHKNLKLQQI